MGILIKKFIKRCILLGFYLLDPLNPAKAHTPQKCTLKL
jgi:hypothetical protein